MNINFWEKIKKVFHFWNGYDIIKHTIRKWEEKMSDTNEKKEEKKMNLQSLGNICLMIIVVLIIGNAILIYYMMNLSDYGEVPANVAEENQANTNEEPVDTIANLISTAVSNTTNTQTNTTVNATDATSRKVMNENLIVLYNGKILDTSKMEQVELKYIDNSSVDKDKYVITYYNYENFAFKDYTLGKLTSPIFDNLVEIENVGKIAISEKYEAITGDIKVINALPTVITDNNSKLSQDYNAIKTIIADLDKNGVDEYVVVLANKTTGYSKISLYDGTGKLVDDLAYIEKAKWNQTTHAEYYLSLENVNIVDIDNDGVMEILVEIPKYEGEPSVSLLKYKNNELTGKTNIECSLLP